ncbi:MAG: class B sortase [Eubacteriales bacterium]|nr:class B sortase [Eubacteriales bacterium]
MAGNSRERKKRKQKKGSIGNVISTVILLVALGVFCYAGYQLITIYFDYKAGTDEYGSLEAYADTNKETEGFVEDVMAENETMGEDEWGDAVLREETGGKEFEQMENPIDFDSLLAMNEDIIGWLEMEAIDINYPIVQGTDNEYYLHRTFLGQDNFAGSIFLDYLNHSNFSNRNNIVYGHNMKNGSMFGILKKYGEQETVDKSPYFWIYTPSRIYKYEIFSAAEVDAYSSSYQITFADSQEFQSFLNLAKNQSWIKSSLQVGYGDTVVTLSTCTGNEATRFIVQAKRVRTYKAVPKAGGYDTPETEG